MMGWPKYIWPGWLAMTHEAFGLPVRPNHIQLVASHPGVYSSYPCVVCDANWRVMYVQADRALRELQRTLLNERALKEWKDAEYFIPPAQRRMLARKESEKRFRRRHFKRMLNLVLTQRQRGF